MEVVRYDVGEVRGVIELPNGGVRVPSALARTGVYEYSDGQKTWREYLPPEEAFSKDSLDSLRGATVTDLHPPELVELRNWRDFSAGHVGDNIKQDGDLIVGELNVFDAQLVQRIKSRERRETSCGYKCTIDPTPGATPDGIHYDAVQRNRRYNHVGVGPEGWGRAGPRVSLRLDGAAYQVSSERVASPTGVPAAVGSLAGDATRSDSSAENPSMVVFKHRNKTYRADSAEEMAAAEKAVGDAETELNGQIASLTKQLSEAMTTAATISAQLEVQKATAAAKPEPAEGEEEEDAEALDARAEKRAELKAVARAILGDQVKLDGMKSADIRKAVVQKTMPEGSRLDGLKSEIIEGMFSGIVAVRAENTKRNDALDAVAAGLQLPTLRPAGRNDGKASEQSHLDADPQARMQQRTRERWKAPLSHVATKG